MNVESIYYSCEKNLIELTVIFACENFSSNQKFDPITHYIGLEVSLKVSIYSLSMNIWLKLQST